MNFEYSPQCSYSIFAKALAKVADEFHQNLKKMTEIKTFGEPSPLHSVLTIYPDNVFALLFELVAICLYIVTNKNNNVTST